MKIAIPTEAGQVCSHFGRAPGFTLVTLDGKAVTGQEFQENPGLGHGSLPAWLKAQGVQAVLAGGMGEHPRLALAAAGMQVCLGVQGSLEAAVRAYLEGTLASGESLCGHDHASGCGHGGCACAGHGN